MPAGVHHAGVLALIHATAFPPGETWDETAFATQLALPGVLGFVAGSGGFVLARVTMDEAEILTLAVAPETRRRGVARVLLAEAERAAGHGGATAIFLEVAENNLAARGLYAAGGYVQISRRRRYYRDGADALLLRRNL